MVFRNGGILPPHYTASQPKSRLESVPTTLHGSQYWTLN